MPTTRRHITGGAAQTTLASGISNSANTVPLTSSTGWPDGSVGPIDFDILEGDLDEPSSYEKCTATGLAGGSLTGVTRGVDGSAASSFPAGATVRHIVLASTVDELNDHTSDITRDDHTQYLLNADHDIEGRHTFGAAYGTPAAPENVSMSAAAAGAGNNPANEAHVHLLADGAITAAKLAANIGVEALGFDDGATTLTDDDPAAANTWEPWGTETLSFTTPLVPVVVKAWLTGNLNGDGLADPQTGEARIEVSFDNGGTWQNTGNDGPTGAVSVEAGETRDAISAIARIAGTPTAAVKVRGALRSEGSSMNFVNGYLMAEWRVGT